MRVFLFYVNTIPGLDEWTDRKLIFEVNKFSEEEDKLFLEINTDEPINFRKLNPSKPYVLQFEYTNPDRIERKYYFLRAFEIIPPPRNSLTFQVTLHIKRIEIEV